MNTTGATLTYAEVISEIRAATGTQNVPLRELAAAIKETLQQERARALRVAAKCYDAGHVDHIRHINGMVVQCKTAEEAAEYFHKLDVLEDGR
jgi:hypothetical protein